MGVYCVAFQKKYVIKTTVVIVKKRKALMESIAPHSFFDMIEVSPGHSQLPLQLVNGQPGQGASH